MIQDVAQWTGLVVAWIGYTMYTITLHRRLEKCEAKINALSTAYNSAIKLILIETKRRDEHLKALKKLSDPDQIIVDLEKSARAREMYEANRRTLPRNDAGPPAKIYSPAMRAKVPKSNYKNKPE